MKRLNLLLQSKFFIGCSLIIIVCYVFLMTKVVKYESKYDEATTKIIGQVLEYSIDGDKLSLQVKGKEKIVVSYYFASEEEKNNFKIRLGEKVILEGKIKVPNNNTIPNTFNYKEYLNNKKMFYVFTAKKITILNEDISFIYKIKNMVLDRIMSFKKTGKYMQAFILGDKDYIESEVYDTYQNNGVTHLFAVSGMHVGLLVGIMVFLLDKLKIKENKRNIIVIIFLVFYMFLIGFTASVVRASLLYVALLINKKTDFNLPSIYVLYLIWLILLVINPFYVYDLGFVYSFLTAFGLMLFSKKITGCYGIKLFKVSLIAFIFSLPITLSNFYEFNLMTVFNNIIIVPLVSAVLFPLTLITFIIPFLEDILVWGFNGLEFVSGILNSFSINVVVGKVNIIFIVIYYSLIWYMYKKGFKGLVYLAFLVVIFKYSYLFDGHNYVYFIDVGQGDASLIVSKRHKDIIMIDTGGEVGYPESDWQKRDKSFNLADNIITFLKSLGISKMDLLVLSHGDMDHLGYAKDIVKDIRIDKLMVNDNNYNKEEKELLSKGYLVIKDGYQGKEVSFVNLNKNSLENENDSSLVLYLTLNNYRFLYMGDAPKRIEEEIIEKYKLKTHFLKVGHHGSDTSSSEAFIREVKPLYSIISVGKNNRYGHPKEEVLKTLEETKILRTDEVGTIQVKFYNNSFKIKTWAP